MTDSKQVAEPALPDAVEGAAVAAETLEGLRSMMEKDPSLMTMEERVSRIETAVNVLIEANAGLLGGVLETVNTTDAQFQELIAVVNRHGRVLGMLVQYMEQNEAAAAAEKKRIITLDQLR